MAHLGYAEPIVEVSVDPESGKQKIKQTIEEVPDYLIYEQPIITAAGDYKEVEAGYLAEVLSSEVRALTAWGMFPDAGANVFWQVNPVAWASEGILLSRKYGSIRAEKWAKERYKAAMEDPVNNIIAKMKAAEEAKGEKKIDNLEKELKEYGQALRWNHDIMLPVITEYAKGTYTS